MRLRYNNLGATAVDNAVTLTAGGTTATWASAPGFPTAIVSPDYAVVVVEPDTVKEEIVYVTAYTAGATTATVSRGREGTTAIAHTATGWTHGPTAADFVDSGPAWDLPAGVIAATHPLSGTPFQDTESILISGWMHLVAINLPAGVPVTALTFVSGITGMSSPDHWWFALYDRALNLLRQTADQLTAGWAASTPKTVNLSAVLTTTYAGLHYLAVYGVFNSGPSLINVSGASGTFPNSIAPIKCGTSVSNLVATAPNPAAAMAASAYSPLAWVS